MYYSWCKHLVLTACSCLNVLPVGAKAGSFDFWIPSIIPRVCIARTYSLQLAGSPTAVQVALTLDLQHQMWHTHTRIIYTCACVRMYHCSILGPLKLHDGLPRAPPSPSLTRCCGSACPTKVKSNMERLTAACSHVLCGCVCSGGRWETHPSHAMANIQTMATGVGSCDVWVGPGEVGHLCPMALACEYTSDCKVLNRRIKSAHVVNAPSLCGTAHLRPLTHSLSLPPSLTHTSKQL